MKELYFDLIPAVAMRVNARRKAMCLLLLAFILSCMSFTAMAQVTVSPAAGGTGICSSTAVGLPGASCTALGTITIAETTNSDFSIGFDQIVLQPPAGWQFCTGSVPVLSAPAGGDVSTPISPLTPATFNASSLTIGINVSGVTHHDNITITGLQVQPLSATAASGFIYASTATGVVGITVGTAPGSSDFGDLSLLPGTITGPSSVCVGDSITLTSVPGPDAWVSSVPTKASVVAISTTQTYVIGHVSGSTVITVTTGGCATTHNVNVYDNPPAMTFSPPGFAGHMCAWYDTMIVSDAVTNGIYNSGSVTIDNFLGTGTGKVHAHAPGTAVIIYTLPTGCFVTSVVTVDPLPNPIQAPPYIVCQGSTKTLLDASPGGTWTSVSTAIGTIDGTGDFYGVSAGTSLVEYAIPGGFTATGCITDTTMTVLPLPDSIIKVDGTTEVCQFSSFRLADPTPGGTWSIAPITIATITPTIPDTAVVIGIGAGTALVSYTGINGCAQTTNVTVDALPGNIAGPDSVCVNDSVQLTDPTPGGTWISGNAFATVNPTTGYVTGITSGVALISYSILPGNCVMTYTVTVHALPAPITSADSVCVGATILLSDDTTGGVFSNTIVPPISYIDPTHHLLGGPGSGVDTICYTLTTGCRVCKPVTIDPLPTPIVGPTSLCLNDSALYTDVTVTGGTWTIGSGLTATATYPDSVSVVASVAGVTSIIYTIPTGGCTTTLFVTVNPIPSIIYSDSAVCVGSSVTLNDSVMGGVWTSSNPHIANIGSSSGIVTGDSSGTVVITYTAPGGCSTQMLFSVYPNAPLVGLTNQICQGDSILITNVYPGGTFSSDNPPVATVSGSGSISETGYIDGITGGTAIISYTLSAGSGGCTSTYPVTVNPITPITPGTDIICVGNSFIITDATPNGVFSSDSPLIASVITALPTVPVAHGVVTGLSAGIDTIVYTITATGCNAAMVVTVNPLPGPIIGADSVCMGDSTRYFESDTSIIGTWSVSNGNAIINPLTGLLLGVQAGYDTVVFTETGSGCTITKSVKINLLYPIHADNNRFCVNTEISLSDTTHLPPGVWSVFHTGIDTIVDVAPLAFGSTAADSGMSAGYDTIAYYIATNGCTAYLAVTIDPLPTITGLHHVCEGSTIVDTGHISGGTFMALHGHVTVTTINADDSTTNIRGVSVGNDTLIYTSAHGCTTAYAIVVDSTPTGIVGDSTVCLYRTEILTDGTINGIWSSVDTNIIKIDSLTGLLQGDSLGRDTIFYTLPTYGCSSHIVVTVEPIPTVILTQVKTAVMCLGDTDRLTATGSGIGGTYTWMPSFGLSATTGASVVASPTLTTTYTVTGTSKYGCDSSSTITVLVDSTFIHIKVVGMDSICRGQTDTLKASGRDSTYFDWHPITSIISPNPGDTIVVQPNNTTTYVGIAIDDIGCKDSVVFTVTVNPLPIVQVTPNPAVECYGTPLQLHATTTNTDNGTTVFVWTPNLFISDDSVSNPIVNDTTNLVYKVTATTIYGCQDSFKVKVSVLDTNVNSIVLDTNICTGSSAQLLAFSHSVNSNLDVPTFTWSPGNTLNDSTIYDPIATPDTTTTYSVHVIENACFDTTMKVTVFVQPYPLISISPASETIIAGTPTQITATVTNTPVLFYAWRPASTLSCDSCLNPVAIPTVTTTYVVTVSSIYHCVDEDSVTLQLLCDNSQVFIPNTFTPNGDGINDRFFVSGKGISLITLMQVYNRWGQLVFEAHNIPANMPAYGWDGTFKGLVLEPDVFVYIVHAQCEQSAGGTDYKYKGDISIVR